VLGKNYNNNHYRPDGNTLSVNFPKCRQNNIHSTGKKYVFVSEIDHATMAVEKLFLNSIVDRITVK
jgi:hypothetical protein